MRNVIEPSPELVEEIARAIERTHHDDDQEFEESWADAEVVRHNRMIEARAVLSSPSIARALELQIAENANCSTPQATGISAIAQERDEEEQARSWLRQREANVIADEIEAGRRHIRNEDMVLVLRGLREHHFGPLPSPPIERSEIGEAPVEQAVNTKELPPAQDDSA